MTFDIPGIDMELLWILKCPDEDSILSDLYEDPISDETTIGVVSWKQLKYNLHYDPYFNREAYFASLNPDEKALLIRLSEA